MSNPVVRVEVTSPKGETQLFTLYDLGMFGGTIDGLKDYLKGLGPGWVVGEIHCEP